MRTNHTNKQWVNLGNHPEACMTLLESCGPAGGAISFWFKRIHCARGISMLAAVSWKYKPWQVICEDDYLFQ